MYVDFDLLVLAAKFEENDDGKRGQICEISGLEIRAVC